MPRPSPKGEVLREGAVVLGWVWMEAGVPEPWSTAAGWELRPGVQAGQGMLHHFPSDNTKAGGESGLV